MSGTSIELTPPLPDGLRSATLTWVAAGAGGAPKPTTRDRAAAAILERRNESGFDDQVRLSVEEADAFLNDVDVLHGRRPSRPTAPKPGRGPRSAPAGPPAPSSGVNTVAAERSTCSRCAGRMQFSGPRHHVHIEDLDSFYRREFDQRMLATTTVYVYECAACHHLDMFTTAT
jgi:hypothetical protein